MDMSNMDHSSHSSSTTSSSSSTTENHMMNMAFHTSITDILFSESWAPKTTGQYAGTCIFLILLTIIHRFLYAYKSVQDSKWHAKEKARNIVVAGSGEGSNSRKDQKVAGSAVVEAASVKSEDAAKQSNPWTTPWRFSTELPRAGLATVTSGLGYLLMLAVMTFNVGYFLSILAGVFVGELAFGRIHKHGDH